MISVPFVSLSRREMRSPCFVRRFCSMTDSCFFAKIRQFQCTSQARDRESIETCQGGRRSRLGSRLLARGLKCARSASNWTNGERERFLSRSAEHAMASTRGGGSFGVASPRNAGMTASLARRTHPTRAVFSGECLQVVPPFLIPRPRPPPSTTRRCMLRRWAVLIIPQR